MKMFVLITRFRGATLLEVMVAIAITAIILLGAGTFLSTSFRNQKILDDQLSGQSEARRIVSEIVNTVRTAETSSVGSYAIATATTSTLTVYANIDNDSFRERVRYWLDGTQLKRGVTKPSGNPLSYSGPELVTVVTANVENNQKGINTFEYFGESYTGTESPLASPVVVPDIRMVRIVVQIEKEESKSPVPIRVESITHIRNLKTN
jgi:prepilin-type N-terminal cleavage/methylation domain-containing protein